MTLRMAPASHCPTAYGTPYRVPIKCTAEPYNY